MTEDNRPFVGIRILEVSRVVASPYAGYLLALLGADVIKIEVPGAGDTTRNRGRGSKPELGKRGMHMTFMSLHANKRSLTLNLNASEGQEIFRKLARDADVVLENLRCGAMAGYGLAYEDLRVENPRLVYCSLTAYGHTGPKRRHPAYDSVVQSASGMMSLNGTPETAPVKVGTQVVDYGTGMAAVIGITSALFARSRTGAGQHVDVSMLDTALSMMGTTVMDVINSGTVPKAQGNRNSPEMPNSGNFQTQDGILTLVAEEPHQHRHLWEAIGRPDVLADPRFATAQARSVNFKLLRAELERTLLRKTAQEWEDILNEAGVPAMRVRNVSEIVDHPQIRSRNLFHHIEHVPGADTGITVPLAPFGLSAGGAHITRPPPQLGAHTGEILAGIGYSDSDVARLRAKKIV